MPMKTEDHVKLLFQLYVTYGVSALLLFTFYTAIVGMLALAIAIVLVYKKRKEATNTIFESHYTWLSRTFWIGTGVLLPLLLLAQGVVFIMQVDTAAITQQMVDGHITSQEEMQAFLKTEYKDELSMLVIVFMAPFTLWWAARCWRGYKLLQEEKPVEKVSSWL